VTENDGQVENIFWFDQKSFFNLWKIVSVF
jgi:hypothetical protein